MRIHTILDGLLFQRAHMLRFSRHDKCALLNEHNIRLVVGLARDRDSDLTEVLGDAYFWNPISDGARLDTEAITALVEQVITMQLVVRGGILCYCNAGRNRSGLMNALLLRQLTGCSGADAVRTVQERRPNALANPAFTTYLNTLESPLI